MREVKELLMIRVSNELVKNLENIYSRAFSALEEGETSEGDDTPGGCGHDS